MQGLAPAEVDAAAGARPGGRGGPHHGLFTTESPALVDACTVALLSATPDVKHLRDRIGAEIGRRLAAALGPGGDPPGGPGAADHLLRGAARRRHGSHVLDGHPRRSWPTRRGCWSARGPGGRGPRVTTVATARLQPLRLRHPRGPLPGLRPAAGRGPVFYNEELDFCASRATPTCWPPSATWTATPTPTASPSTQRLRPQRPPGHVVPRPGPAASHPDALVGRQELHAVQGGRPWRTTSGPSPWRTSSRPSSTGPSTSSPTSPAGCRWT